MKEKNKDLIFIIIGIFILIIFLIDFFLKIRIYRKYEYLWFCGISLLLLAIGYILRSKTFILSFLPISILAQSIWILDYYLLLFNLKPITDNSNYMFNYGQTFLEFLIGLKHFFIIPMGFIGLLYIKKPIKKYFWIISIIIGYITLLLPLFIPYDNINCVKKNCFNIKNNLNQEEIFYDPIQNQKNFDVLYFFFLAAFSTFFVLSVGFIIKKILEKKRYQKYILYLIIILIIIGLTGSVFGIMKYFQKPHVYCVNKNSNIFCEKIFDKNETHLFIRSHIKNRIKKTCEIEVYANDILILKEKKEILEDSQIIYIYIKKPLTNQKIELKDYCY
ncbi:MAG: hypothetical protein QXW97_03505 [Candidatus Pacearchaeota archaeon]